MKAWIVKLLPKIKWGLLVAILAMIAALALRWSFKMAADNPFEELSEELFEKETGIDLDISPGTPEN